MEWSPLFANSISNIESGGDYNLLGPVTKSGDRAYGKYQVMGSNIPSWTKEALGKELTPAQFRSDPQAQEAVFQHRFGQYVDKYGPEGAAKAWFAGEAGMNSPQRRDQLGTSVESYGKRFMAGINQAPSLPPHINVPSLPPIGAPAAPQNAVAQAQPMGSLPAYSFTPVPTETAFPISPPPIPKPPVNIGQFQQLTPMQWVQLFRG